MKKTLKLFLALLIVGTMALGMVGCSFIYDIIGTPSVENPSDENPPVENPPVENPSDENPPEENPPVHEHSLALVSGNAATCLEAGVADYYTCSCGKLFADENGTTEIDAPAAIEALGHKIVTDEAVDPTCTTNGLTAGEHCERCDYSVAQEEVPATGIHTDDDNDYFCDACEKDLVVRFELHQAEMHCSNGVGAVYITENPAASDGQDVQYFNAPGQVLVLVINSDKAEENVPLVFTACTGDTPVISADIITRMITINGVSIKNVESDIPGGAWGSCTYGTTVGYVDLVEGENVIAIAYKGLTVNLDYIDLVPVEATLTWNPILNGSNMNPEKAVCADEDGNHLCDLCGGATGSFADEDGDGLCDVCGENCAVFFSKVDNDENVMCGVCGDGSSVAEISTEQAHSGTESIKLTSQYSGYPSPHCLVQITLDTPVDATGCDYLVFWVYDTVGYDTNGLFILRTAGEQNLVEAWTPNTIVGNQWSKVVIYVGDYDVSAIKYLYFGIWNAGTRYIDDIYFTDNP